MLSALPIQAPLLLAGALFCIGLFGALARRNLVAVLMGVELMLNAVNINLVVFWRYFEPAAVSGQVFAIFIIAVAAAEAAVGLAMVIAAYRSFQTINSDQIDSLQG